MKLCTCGQLYVYVDVSGILNAKCQSCDTIIPVDPDTCVYRKVYNHGDKHPSVNPRDPTLPMTETRKCADCHGPMIYYRADDMTVHFKCHQC